MPRKLLDGAPGSSLLAPSHRYCPLGAGVAGPIPVGAESRCHLRRPSRSNSARSSRRAVCKVSIERGLTSFTENGEGKVRVTHVS